MIFISSVPPSMAHFSAVYLFFTADISPDVFITIITHPSSKEIPMDKQLYYLSCELGFATYKIENRNTINI